MGDLWTDPFERRTPTVPEMLNAIQVELDRPNLDDAILTLYTAVDRMCYACAEAEDWSPLDLAFEEDRWNLWPLDLSVGLLTITLPARHRLDKRMAFFERVSSKLLALGENPMDTLFGLR